MVALDGAIANRVSFTPKSSVRRVSCRAVAAGEVEGAVGAIRDLEGWSCLATVEVLGEFGPAERYTHERAGRVQADLGHAGRTRRGLPACGQAHRVPPHAG